MKKNKAYQGLRFFAFLNVFLLHVNSYRITSFYNNAAWAVSFFFIISGFLNGYQLFENDTLKIKDTFKFSLKKIIKFYPLYLLCIIAFIPFSQIILGSSIDSLFIHDVKKLAINIFLIQSWSFDRTINYGFTGVGWFLSDFVFLIIITVPVIVLIKKILDKNKNKSFNIRLMSILFFVFALMAIYYYFIITNNLDYAQFFYIFPIGRMFEYLIALIFGCFVRNNESSLQKIKPNKILFSILELLSIIMIIYLFKIVDSYNLLSHSLGWILPNLFLIFIFYFENGFFSKIIGNKLFVHLGDLSFNMYIIHQVINMYFYIVPTMNDNLTLFRKFKCISFVLLFTLLISEYLYKNNIFEKCEQKLLNIFCKGDLTNEKN